MNRRIAGVIGGTATLTLLVAALQSPALAAPPEHPVPDDNPSAAHRPDDRPNPMETKRRGLKKQAAELVLTGRRQVQTRDGSESVRVAPGQWAEYGVQDTGQVLSFLVEFGDQIDGRFRKAPAGPLHNQIPEPDRSRDNSTYWLPDFDRQHFMDMFFHGMSEQGGESFRGIYEEMSSGRFTVDGDVSDWVKVPFHEASYGTTESHTDMTRFIDDTADSWFASQQAAGRSDAEIAQYLKSFDVWDRYDHDADGDFAEPDGYVDHFQAIHAGEGEEAGAPESAIWSHRWAVNQDGSYPDGAGPEGARFGGIEIGNTGLWIRDYTTEPENGGLGVFAHEFGHDLGLPDLYDTQGGENSTAFWTLMSSGSWLNHGGDAIGTTPNHMGPWEKFMLGWLDYEVARAGESSAHTLGPSYHASKHAQAVITVLPKHTVTSDIGPAAEGTDYFYSGTGDNRVATTTSPDFTVPAGGDLAAKVKYDIEADWDYAYAEISTDGGQTFSTLATNLSTDLDPNGSNDGHGITGSSNGSWVDLTADLAGYEGQTARIRFRMVNDAAVHEIGFMVDAISVAGALTEGVEDGAPGWTLDKFLVAENGRTELDYAHYYLAENRQYLGYDTTLRQGPYNFGWAFTAPDRVERFPYQDGLLVWYWNTQYTDNNVSQHPGGGEVLPVDARAQALRWSNGTVARNRIQAFDSTFGMQPTDALSLHREYALAATKPGGKKSGPAFAMSTLDVGSRPAVRVFDDSNPMAYYDSANPGGSVKVAGVGVRIGVVSTTSTGTMQVAVN